MKKKFFFKEKYLFQFEFLFFIVMLLVTVTVCHWQGGWLVGGPFLSLTLAQNYKTQSTYNVYNCCDDEYHSPFFLAFLSWKNIKILSLNWIQLLNSYKWFTFGVSNPTKYGAIIPETVPIVFEIPLFFKWINIKAEPN